MQGMMLGLLDGLASVLNAVFKGVIELVLEPFMNLLVGPILNYLFNILNYMLSIYFYGISIFILGLIDFVEMLFRALAGLAVEEGRAGIELSLDGKSGDILVQLIRHPDVQQAFLAMCIVGLFLLVVTTVFQIIKVEYTTEGAKNSKTPIFQKAFKGLANLMLLPILCIFGIVFSNQLLGLLDKATKSGGENPTIAGTLFVTAASEAHYKKTDAQFLLVTADPSVAVMEILLNSYPILFQSMKDMINDNFIGYEEEYREPNIDDVEDGFINQREGHCYYLISNVSNYYNYGKINYILLIFGGSVVLKCLYFTCFGMVIRLYKCAVLFIISPAVIGMTPVNEGGLGKWRGQFIGQVLSAYGTVLSINIFFIVVRVLLSIDVSFVNLGNKVTMQFTNNFMTGLLKSIFVIAGCLLIEKFAKELGGFFGAEDALSAGKDMSKQVTDVAMKGVQVAATVAGAAMTGGANLVGSVVSGAKSGGIAGALKGGLQTTKLGGAIIGAVEAHQDKKDRDFNNSEDGQKAARDRKTAIDRSKKYIAEVTGSEDYVKLENDEKEAQAKVDKIKEDNAAHGITGSTEELEEAQKALKAVQESKADYENTYRLSDAKKDLEKNEALNKKYAGAQGRIDEKKQKRKDSMANAALYAASFMAQSEEEAKGFIPGFKQFVQPIDKTAHSGAKLLGDHAEQAFAGMDKKRQKKVEDKWMDNPTIAKSASDTLLGSAAQKFTKQFIDEFKAAQQNVTVEANATIDNLKDYLDSIKKNENLYKGGKFTAEGAQMRMDAINNAANTLNAKGANVNFSDVAGMVEKAEVTGKIDIQLSDLKMDMDPKKFEKAMQDALKKSGGTMNADILRDELTKVFAEQGEKGNKNMLIQIEAIVKKVMNDLK